MHLLFALVLSAAPGVDPEKVNAAIGKGVKWLQRGHGETRELALLALLHGGVRTRSPIFREHLERMLKDGLSKTYRVALQAMVLEELDRVRYQRRILQCAQFLVDNQAKNGQWGYGKGVKLSEAGGIATQDGRRRTSSGSGEVAVFGQTALAMERVKPKVRRKLHVKQRAMAGGGGDNSNSQYALLGLRACHDAGIVIPTAVIDRSRKWWLLSQHTPGVAKGRRNVATGVGAAPRGWGYRGAGKNAYGSMTAGAVGALVICDYILKKRWKSDPAVRAGVAWLAASFTVEENPGRGGGHHYYYLYGLERAGMLYGTEKFGRRAWYDEGAEYLVKKQHDNGSWGDPKNTCFAILFLRRATRPLVATPGR